MEKKIEETEIREWFESEDESVDLMEPLENKSLEKRYAESQLQVIRTSMDFTLYHLKQSLDNREYINASPKYQRRHRWDIKKRSQLIESFLMNIPVPSVFLYENYYNQYEIMDGKQRIDTLRSFLNDEFALRGLEFWKELDDKRFSELPNIIQRGLSRRTLNAVVLLAETSKSDKSGADIRKILFKRLNTGGVQLNPQELRNALYPGRFNEMILDLSRSEPFVTTWGIPAITENEEVEPDPDLLKNNLYKNMVDCELVLRFFAIKYMVKHDKGGSLRSLLDRTYKREQSCSAERVSILKKDFQRAIEGLYEIFGEETFIVPTTSRLSRPLYDALMVAYSLLNDNDFASYESIASRLKEYSEDDEGYETLVGRRNTTESVKNRVTLAKKILSDK